MYSTYMFMHSHLTYDPVDMAQVIDRVPSVEVSAETADQLQLHLNLPNNGHTGKANLKELVKYCHKYKSPLPLEDLVRALMLTPGLGRFVAKLLPFCKSTYCPFVPSVVKYACTCAQVCLFSRLVYTALPYLRFVTCPVELPQ